MALTENFHTGDGSTVLYSFTFPYLSADDVKVTLDGVSTTAYSLANATTVELDTAPDPGVSIRIYRDTPLTTVEATFFPGSSIRAQDLNDNFTQLLYVTQETNKNALSATEDYTISGVWNFVSNPTGVYPTASNQLVNKQYVDSVAVQGVSDGVKGDVTVSNGGSVWTVNGALKSADLGVTVQPYDANISTLPPGGTILVTGDIGATVQPYDADTAKTDQAQTWTWAQTFNAKTTLKEIKETVYTLGTTGSVNLNPTNGTIQVAVLTGPVTFVNLLGPGSCIVLHLEGGDAHAVTWPSMTWIGGAAPTLTAKDVLVLWKVSNDVYGTYVGSYA